MEDGAAVAAPATPLVRRSSSTSAPRRWMGTAPQSLERRRSSALVSGWFWAARAASMRSWWAPTTMVRPPVAVVQRSRKGQAAQTPASKTNFVAGRPALVILGGPGVGRGLAGRTGHRPGVHVDAEVGLGETAAVGDRRNLGRHLRTLVLHRLAHIAIGVGHVTQQGVDLDAVGGLDIFEQRGGAVAVAGVAGPQLDTDDHLGVLVDHHVELVAIEAPRRRLAAVVHLGVGVAHHPIRCHALADRRLAVVALGDVLVDHLGQQIAGPDHRRVVGHLALPRSQEVLS